MKKEGETMKNFDNMSFSEMRAEVFKMMDKTCKENNISRDELINQIDKHSRKQERKNGNINIKQK